MLFLQKCECFWFETKPLGGEALFVFLLQTHQARHLKSALNQNKKRVLFVTKNVNVYGYKPQGGEAFIVF